MSRWRDSFGFELDLTALPEEEIVEMTDLVQLVKETRHLLRSGDFHRLSDPFTGHVAAWEIVSPDRSEAVVTATLAFVEPNFLHLPLKLRGLDRRRAIASCTDPRASGLAMSDGARPARGLQAGL